MRKSTLNKKSSDLMLAVAQDYWLQVLTVQERYEIGEIVGYIPKEPIRKALHRRLEWLIANKYNEIIAHEAKNR